MRGVWPQVKLRPISRNGASGNLRRAATPPGTDWNEVFRTGRCFLSRFIYSNHIHRHLSLSLLFLVRNSMCLTRQRHMG